MATIQELERALINADAAGDVAAARDLAAAITSFRATTAGQIPGEQVVPSVSQPAEPTLAERAVGAGEAALTLGTGAVGGTLGMLGGTLKGLAEQILSGQFGTTQAANLVQQSAQKGAEALTYSPRTQAGQEQVQAVGEALSFLPPVVPVVGAPGAVARGASMVVPAIEQAARKAAPQAQAITQKVIPPVKRAVATAAEIVRPSAPTKTEPTIQTIPIKAAPVDVLGDTGVRARPAAVPLDAVTAGKRDLVLDAIGIPADSRRLGARTGDKNQIQTEIMISKLDGADKMRQQLDLESQRLAEYAAAIQRDTGGTAGATPLSRGEAISAPLEGYQKWYNDQIRELYNEANQSAAGQGGIRLDRLKEYLNEPANFKGDGRSVSRDMRNELVRLSVMDKKGNLSVIDAPTAERIRQEANSLFDPTKPQTKNAVAGVKNAIDEDVLSVLPSDVYLNARAKRAQYREIFEDPKGIAQILDISGPDGVNRAVALDVLPDKLVNYAAKNTAQFNNIIRTLETLPTPELQALGKQAISEVRAHLIEKIISKNIDLTEASLGGQVVWRGTDDTLSKQMAPYRGKTKQLLGEDLANRLETLRVGARILRPFDPNPSGTATTALNLQTEFAKKAIGAAGGLAGAGIGAMTGGPAGAAGGAIAGASAAKKIINVRQQKAIDRAIQKSLGAQKKQNR